MPNVSVIMPSYNKEKYIEKAIRSILEQTYADFELLIIEDASSDNSIAVIQSFSDKRIRLFRNKENMGIAAARNMGLEHAQGAYIALLDADDIATEYRLEKEVCFLDTHPDIDVVFGGFDEMDENDISKENYFVPLKNPEYIKARLLVQDVIPNGSCMYRKEFVDRHGIRYRNGYLGMDDYQFWVECSLYGRISSIPDLLLHWRNIEENSTNRYKYAQEYEAKRRQKYAQIQRDALKSNGFDLTEAELKVYTNILSEHHEKITSQKDIIDFWNVVKKLCDQAGHRNHPEEMKKMFRKQFGLSLENSYLWD